MKELRQVARRHTGTVDLENECVHTRCLERTVDVVDLALIHRVTDLDDENGILSGLSDGGRNRRNSGADEETNDEDSD